MLVRFAAVRSAMVVLVAAGCSTGAHYTLDGGPPPDAAGITLNLSLVSMPSLVLGFEERTALEVVLRDGAGAPVVGEPIAFSIDGTPADASLVAAGATTDASGRASVELVAGLEAASFRVRIAHPRARFVFVDVAVGAAFGMLRVTPTYAGTREIARTIVHVFSDRTCAEALEDSTGGLERVLPDGAREVILSALPIGLAYTVLTRGEASGGALHAAACVGGVTLSADVPTTLEVALRDTAIGYDGSYVLMIALDASPAVASLDVPARAAVALGGSAGDAARMVEALAATLDAGGDWTLAAAGLADRVARELVISTELGAGGLSPSDALVEAIGAAIPLAGTLAVPGWLSVGLTGDPTIAVEAVSFGGPDDTITLDSTLLPIAPVLTSRIDVPMDALVVDRLVLELPLGTLLSLLLEAHAAAGGSTLARTLDTGACDVLSRAIAGDVALAAACDVGCRADACDGAIASLLSDLAAALAEIDLVRARIVLTGALASTDTDGDAHTDLWSGELAGSWQDASGTDQGVVGGVCTAALPFP